MAIVTLSLKYNTAGEELRWFSRVIKVILQFIDVDGLSSHYKVCDGIPRSFLRETLWVTEVDVLDAIKV